jgi:hypothetical protein
MVEEHQTHLAVQLITDSSDFSHEHVFISTDRYQKQSSTVTSTLPESNILPERQIELLFRLEAALFSLYNYINQRADNSKISRNTKLVSSLTHISDIHEDHMKHLDIHFYL